LKEIKLDPECIETKYNKFDALLVSTASGL